MTKYIFIDLDGTLLDKTSDVPASASKAIKQAMSNNHKVFVSTGRAKSGVPDAVTDINFDGYIYSAGTVIEIGDEQIYFDRLSETEVMEMINLLTENGVGFSMEGYEKSFFDNKSKKIFEAIDYVFDLDKMYHGLEVFNPQEDAINKFALFSDSADTFCVLEDVLPNHLKLIVHDNKIHGIALAEIVKCHVNKATGIQRVLDYYKANQKHTICFGDSLNDYEMVEFCELGICMEDGSETLKRIANGIAHPAEEDGLARCFQEIGLI